MSFTVIRTLAFTALLSAGSAQAFVINANLDDWGVQRNGQASGLVPNSNAKAYKIEDQNTTYLNPGYGGQAYDAEAMYVAWDNSNLYIAIATGHSPLTVNTPTSNIYGAGDIAIDFGVNGSFEYGVELLSGTLLSNLNNTTTKRTDVYSGVNWAVGVFRANGSWTGYYDPSLANNVAAADASHPTSIRSGTDVGNAVVAYTTLGQNNFGTWAGDQHFFYEVSVPLSAFGPSWQNGSAFRVHWTQNCANDAIWVDATATKQVPEPGTLALLPLGLLGLAALRRNKGTRKG
jgi:hypothetical protein